MNLTNILNVNNLSKTYHSKNGEIIAVNNVSFNVNKEEFVGIIGPSGCGKSSILNIISNLDTKYKGRINVNKNIKIAYMLQEDALFPWLTILENVLLGLKIKKQLTKENKDYAIMLLKKYGLYEFRNKYPKELSGGMKQRVVCML